MTHLKLSRDIYGSTGLILLYFVLLWSNYRFLFSKGITDVFDSATDLCCILILLVAFGFTGNQLYFVLLGCHCFFLVQKSNRYSVWFSRYLTIVFDLLE